MKTKAAVLRGVGQEWEVIELDLDPPKEHEVLIRFVAAGLCHSDEHLRNGDLTPRFPMVGGHEGAGVIEEIGPSVERVKVGDHVVCSNVPVCGTCRFCSTGQQNLCDMGAVILEGSQLDGTFRFHNGDEEFGGMCALGTFSQWSVIPEYSCVPIDKDLPLEVAVLTGCAVPTGWGSATNHRGANIRPGETVVIYGIGGIGINAVQGAKHAGAKNLVVVDPLANKREIAEQFGATHSVATSEEAHKLVVEELTLGVGADSAIVTVGLVEEEVCQSAIEITRKGGRIVITGLSNPEKKTLQTGSSHLVLYQKSIHGLLSGGWNPLYDIPQLMSLYRSGDLKLDELVTKRYKLEDISQGYQDLLDGKNIRGAIAHVHV